MAEKWTDDELGATERFYASIQDDSLLAYTARKDVQSLVAEVRRLREEIKLLSGPVLEFESASMQRSIDDLKDVMEV